MKLSDKELLELLTMHLKSARGAVSGGGDIHVISERLGRCMDFAKELALRHLENLSHDRSEIESAKHSQIAREGASP